MTIITRLFYVLEQGKIILFSRNNAIVTCLWVGVKGGGGAGGWQASAALADFLQKFHCRGAAACVFMMGRLLSKHRGVSQWKQ